MYWTDMGQNNLLGSFMLNSNTKFHANPLTGFGDEVISKPLHYVLILCTSCKEHKNHLLERTNKSVSNL